AEEEGVAPTAPTEEGGLLSGDDALVWLQSLAAGKEDELRTQAEAEQQVRVDEIMGRKRLAKPAEPVVEEVAPVAAAEEVPAWLHELQLPAEEITAVAEVTEEEAEELRAQAKSEQQARIDEIMGRKRPAKPAEPVVEEVVPIEVAEEIPAWLRELQPQAEEVAAITEVAEAEAEELRAQAKSEQQARVDEIMGRKRPARPAEPAEAEEEGVAVAETSAAEKRSELFGWSSFDAEDRKTQRTPEPETPVEELVSSFGFTRFKGEKETVAPKPSPVEERVPDVVVEPPAVVSTKPEKKIEEIAVPLPAFELEERKDYVKANETDYPARLELAQALWVRTERKESLQHYKELLQNADELLDSVVSDLQAYSQKNPEENQALQLLGDAYMKQGSPHKALGAYRKAMSSL
ncbi:MAG: hypothetical protein K8R89_06755, partial [Anaerolineae bacterium]|nr:hypothetical protein [Anaerolineae bacterium]